MKVSEEMTSHETAKVLRTMLKHGVHGSVQVSVTRHINDHHNDFEWTRGR